MNIDIIIPWKDGDGNIVIQGNEKQVNISVQNRISNIGYQKLIFITTGRAEKDFSVLDIWYTNGVVQVTCQDYNPAFDSDNNLLYVEYTPPEYIKQLRITEDNQIRITGDSNIRILD